MEALSESSILQNLKTSFVGQRILYFPRLTSTMDVARKAARERAKEGTVVVAEEQTAGRGRRGRVWFSPQGSLAFSLILHPTPSQLPYLVMVASLAVVHSIEALTRLHAQIKWPNDILIGGKKVSGILIESDLKGGEVKFAIVGIGLNVNVAPPSLPLLSIPATSLLAEVGKEISRLELLCRLLAELENLYLAARAGQSPVPEWRERLVTLGQWVQVEVEGTVMLGVAESTGEDGSLLLRREDGSLARIVAGDVSLWAV